VYIFVLNKQGDRDMTAGDTIKLNGISYEVLKIKDYNHKGGDRQSITMKRPAGKKRYNVIRYENGSFSSIVGGF